jgi:hypothetical protein
MRSRVRIRTHGSVGRRRLRPPLTRFYTAKAPCRLIQAITLLAGVVECISFQHPCLTASAGFWAEPQL